MPGGDRTGPMGMGPMTGRGAGFCGGTGVPGFANRGPGLGFGRGRGGRGGGNGRRNMFHATGLTGWQRAAHGQPGRASRPRTWRSRLSRPRSARCSRSSMRMKKRLAELEAEKG